MLEYEIEIKSLLGSQENADMFRNHILEKGAEKKSENEQLNHYFIGNGFEKLLESLKSYLSDDQYMKLEMILAKGENHSIRTREINGITKLVIKASVDDTTSENGIARMEFEESLDMDIDELDALLLEAGFSYQAKWSRKREEYRLEDVNISLDKNAGYGWLTEFEIVLKEDEDRHQAESHIRQLMDECGVSELDQGRLSRMFDYYNTNWKDYYGTEEIFTIE